MFVIYHYEEVMGKVVTLIDATLVPSAKIAEEWIKDKGLPSMKYHYKKVEYYFGKRTW